MSPYERAVRENLPPPGYTVGNVFQDGFKGAYCGTGWYWYDEVRSVDHMGTDRRQCCLAAWADFDERNPG